MQVIMMMTVVGGVEGLQDPAWTRLLIVASSAQRSSLVIVIIINIVITIATILRTKMFKGHLLGSLSPSTLMKGDDDNNVCNS